MPLFDILFNEEQRRLYDLHTVIGEVGRFMQSDGGINALISPWVASRLSSLAVVSEFLHQLHLFKPWSRRIEDDMEVNRSIMRDRYRDFSNTGYQLGGSASRVPRSTDVLIQLTECLPARSSGDGTSRTLKLCAKLKRISTHSGKQLMSTTCRKVLQSRSKI